MLKLSQGAFGAYEDKKHRATYEALDDPEKKFRFFSARQVACRLLGSRGYLCQKVISLLLFLNCFVILIPCIRSQFLLILGLQCWLAMEDCMCSNVKPYGLWKRIRFWLYMHPRVSIGLPYLV